MAAFAAEPTATEDAKLANFFQTWLAAECQHAPVYATRLGDHKYDDQLDDLSTTALAAGKQRAQATKADLAQHVNRAALSRGAQIDYDILAHSLERTLWLNEHTNPYADDPRTYNEYINDSVYLLLTQSTAPPERNVQNAIRRLQQLPKIIAAAKANLRHPPRILTETASRQNRGAINFYTSGIAAVAGTAPGLNDLTQASKQAAQLLTDYQKYLDDELLPKSTGDWRLGKEKFARKLELELEAGVTADEVLREAEAEAERVEREMYVLARQLWSQTRPKQALPPDDAVGRRAAIRQVLAVLARDHGQVENLVADVRGTVERIKQFIASHDILRLPDPDRCQIVEMPEFQRGFSTAYLNPAPPLDPAARSYYAVSPPPREWDARRVTSYLEEYNRAMLQILTIHEAYPGHYVQLEYANRHPSLIRKVLYSGVFAEGWAVYTEQMMIDQGYGQGDLSLRLHQLKWYLRAVVNAILDHKMHCTNLSDAEALDLLVKRAFQSEGEAIGKIARAKQSSCQLSTYFVGRMAFYRLRQAVAREQGDAFHLGRFHEAVLAHGTLPVKYLPELVRTRLTQPR